MIAREPAGMWLSLFAFAATGLALVLGGPHLYDELKSWQTLIAGILGFGGLAWVTYLTAGLSRQRDAELAAEARQNELQRREEEGKSLAMALGWELAHTLRELVTIRRRLIEHQDRPQGGRRHRSLPVGAQIENIPAGQLFDRAIDKLLLPPQAIARLSGFYYDLADLEQLPAVAAGPSELPQVIDRLRVTVEAGNDALKELRAICGHQDFPEPFLRY